jgi:anti-anti-sigma factor
MDIVDIVMAEGSDGSTTLRIGGELDIGAIPALARAIEGMAVDGRIVVDLLRVTFVDSVGLRWLVRLHNRTVRAGGRLSTLGSPVVRRLLEISGLAALLDDD